jgi:hypothetical protein
MAVWVILSTGGLNCPRKKITEVNPAIEQNEEDLDSLLLDFDETYV